MNIAKPTLAFWITAAVIAVTFGVLQWFVPLAFDDWMFVSVLREQGGSLVDFARVTRQVDNARLANILCPVMAVGLPRWLVACLCGLATAVMYALMARLAHVGATGLALIWAVSLILMPWLDNIIVLDYMLNYVFSSCAALAFIYIICVAAKGRLSGAFLTLGVILAILAGWMHEGFAAPLCVALGIFALTRKLRISGQWWLLFGALVLATAWTVSAPGILARAGSETGNFWDIMPPAKLAYCSLGIALMAAALLATAILRRQVFAQVCKSPVFIVLVAWCLVATVMALVLRPNMRYFWVPDMSALIVTAMVAARWFSEPAPAVKRGVWIVVTVAMCAEMCHLIYWQRVFYKQESEILAAVEASPTGTVFYDLNHGKTLPMTALSIPVDKAWYVWNTYCVLNQWHQTFDRKVVSVLPADLRGASSDEMVPMADAPGFYDLRGHIFKRGHSAYHSYTEYLPGPDGRECLAVNTVLAPGDTVTYLRPLAKQ